MHIISFIEIVIINKRHVHHLIITGNLVDCLYAMKNVTKLYKGLQQGNPNEWSEAWKISLQIFGSNCHWWGIWIRITLENSTIYSCTENVNQYGMIKHFFHIKSETYVILNTIYFSVCFIWTLRADLERKIQQHLY